MRYTIIVHNAQGASEQHTAGTKAAIEQWLQNTWSDVRELTAVVHDARLGSGYRAEVGSKAAGRLRIKWARAGQRLS